MMQFISVFQLIGRVLYMIMVIGFGLLDYPTLVPNPMDLGTVNQKLNDGEYLYVEDMLDQIQLIWDNCKIYNLAGSVNLFSLIVDL